MATIEHVDIPDRYQHEPKGVAAATAGHHYRSNGAGSGSFAAPNGDLPTNWELISSNIPTAASVLSYTWDESLYNGIRVVFNGLRTDTDADTLSFRLGHTGGTDMADAAGNYRVETNDMSTTLWVYDITTSSWELNNADLGNVSTETASGRIIILGNQDPNLGCLIEADCLYQDTAGVHKYRFAQGLVAEADVWSGNPDVFQMRLASGAFVATGNINLYGLLP